MKDPAVLFYTQDFITGTIFMSDEQRGKYIMLLCLQHQNGKLSEREMLKICGEKDEDIWCKFYQEDGYFYNKRMLLETEKRTKYSESRRNNRVKKEDNICKTYDSHMENENEDVIVDVNSNEYELSKLLFDLIKKRNPNHKEPNLESWAKHIDLMIRIDKRTIEEIRGCINWCQQDSFWQNNILSTAKLRKQFDTLYLKAKGSKNGTSASITEDKLRRIAESIANDDRLK